MTDKIELIVKLDVISEMNGKEMGVNVEYVKGAVREAYDFVRGKFMFLELVPAVESQMRVKKMDVTHLARAIGVKPVKVNAWLYGTKNIPIESEHKILKCLDLEKTYVPQIHKK